MQDFTLSDTAATIQRATLLFWIAGFLSLGFALGLWLIGYPTEAMFVASWPVAILLLGYVLLRRARKAQA